MRIGRSSGSVARYACLHVGAVGVQEQDDRRSGVGPSTTLANRVCFGLALNVVLLFALVASAEELSFEKHVRPILKAQCFHCHGEDPDLPGGLDVRLVRLMKAGGDSGEAIVPGDANASLLWQRIAADEMPEGSKKLSPAQKKTIRDWINAGAKTLRAEPVDVQQARFSQEELSHWAYQAVEKPAIPGPVGFQCDTPIDNFIGQKLAENELGFSPPADRRTLIRRVSFNLLGLPPDPAEVARFVSDPSPLAYQQLVDRMIASPQFGVRWARHWLDVAGFAETNGPEASDGDRPHVWRYRDYVVDAFNESKSVDQFFVEQLAGDELVEGNVDLQNARHFQLLAATGFLRLAPDRTKTENSLEQRNNATAEAVKTISSAMLGVTVGCAQCHDHKYDPIGIDDYYRFRAVFDPLFPLQNWRQPGSQLVDFTTQEVLAEEAEIEVRAKAVEDDIQQRRNAHGKHIQELKLADVPEADREATREAVLTEPGKRTDTQNELLKTYPMVKPVSTIAGGLLVEYDSVAYRNFEKEKEKVTAIRATKPPRRIVMVTRESPDVVPASHVFFRGNPESPGEDVAPAELMVLRREREIQLPTNDDALPTTGRRLNYARQLTNGSHPLAARVFVNRVWQHHFGRGLVRTPGDFGISGEVPTHPELLDWLAADFVEHGWDQKRLHRMILLSRTFQQSSRRTQRLNEIDPQNTLYGRANLRRLEAEAIRDSILQVTDALDPSIGGPSLPVVEAPDGKVVIGKAKIRDGLKTGVNGSGGTTRRSIYIQVQRRLPLNVLATFDQPEMNPNCQSRQPSTVATQSLWFLNDQQIIQHAQRLAAVVMRHDSQDEQFAALFERLFATEPTESERHECSTYLLEQKTRLGESQIAMASLCQALLASNRFLYVD